MSQPPSQPDPGQPFPQQPYQGRQYPEPQQYPQQANSDATAVFPSAPQPGQARYPEANEPDAGYPQGDYPQGGYAAGGNPQGGYAAGGNPQGGYSAGGNPQGGYAAGGNPQGGYEQPGYQQPGYPQPGYQQPGYPQPGYPQSGAPAPGAFPPVPAKKKSKALPIVLISLAVVLVLCVGGGIAAFFAAKDGVAEIAETAQRPATGGSDPSGLPSGAATGKPDAGKSSTITLVAPTKLNGRPKLTDPQFSGTAESMKEQLAGAPGATGSIGALYGDPAKRNIVIIAGVEAPVADPQKELTATLFGLGTGGLKVTGITTVDAGSLGGEAKCGNANVSGTKMALCAWADDGSVGWIIWYFKSVNQVKGEFTKLRGQIEKVS